MSATTKLTTAEVREIARHAPNHDGAVPSLLDEILSRVDVIEAKQSRPSPVALRTWEEIERFADKAARSGMVPKDFIGKPDAICIAIQMGSELGLAPMQALQNIAVVNGRPSIWGDAMPALCRASGILAYMREWHEGEGDALTYYCEAKRKDDPNPVRSSFSVADAKQAGLWRDTPTIQKRSRDGGTYQADSGPWYSYRPRMLQMRARGFCLRDACPDVLKGLITAEEARDIPFEDTGLTPRMPGQANDASHHWNTVAARTNAVADASKGAAIDPASPPKKTWATLLDEIEASFTGAENRDAVDAIMASDNVQRALDKASNGVKERLDRVIAAALAKFPLPLVEPPVVNDPMNEPAPEEDPLDAANTQSMLERVAGATSVADLTRMEKLTSPPWRQEFDALSNDGQASVKQAIADRLAELRSGA